MLKTIIESLEEGQFVIIKTKVFNKGQKDESQKTYSGIISYISDKHISFAKASVIHNYTKGKQYGGDSIVKHFSIDREVIHNIVY